MRVHAKDYTDKRGNWDLNDEIVIHKDKLYKVLESYVSHATDNGNDFYQYFYDLEAASIFLKTDIPQGQTVLRKIKYHDLNQFHDYRYQCNDDLLDMEMMNKHRLTWHNVLTDNVSTYATGRSSYNIPTVLGYAIIAHQRSFRGRDIGYHSDCYELDTDLQHIKIIERHHDIGCSDSSWSVEFEDIATCRTREEREQLRIEKLRREYETKEMIGRLKFWFFVFVAIMFIILFNTK